jgi:hypothetical protein
MPRQSLVGVYTAEIDAVLAGIEHLDPTMRELILKACLKKSRERRYFGRDFNTTTLSLSLGKLASS